MFCILAIIPSISAAGTAAVFSPVRNAASSGFVFAVATAANAAAATIPIESQERRHKKQRLYDKKQLCRLLGMSKT